ESSNVELLRRISDLPAPGGTAAVIRAGTTVLLPSVDAGPEAVDGADLRAITAALRAAPAKSGLLLPLRARGRVFGVLTLYWTKVRPLEPGLVAFTEELAGRLAAVLDN